MMLTWRPCLHELPGNDWLASIASPGHVSCPFLSSRTFPDLQALHLTYLTDESTSLLFHKLKQGETFGSRSSARISPTAGAKVPPLSRDTVESERFRGGIQSSLRSLFGLDFGRDARFNSKSN